MTGKTSEGAPPAAGGRRAFPRQFWLLSSGMLVLMAGIDMCFPFETGYLHGRLGASMTTIGLVLGIPLLIALPLYILGGAFTDRYGRKPAMIAGISVLTCLYLTFGLASSLWQIAIAVAVEAAFGWALFLTGSNAMIADLVAHERRAEAYSITRVALNIGMVIGPLVAGVLIAADPTYRTLFLSGASICAVYVVIVIGWFRETRPAAVQAVALRQTLTEYGAVLRDRRFLVFCALSLLPLYGFGQIWSIFPIALRIEHGISPRTWGYLLAFYAAVAAVSSYPLIRWLRRRDHLLLMAAASAGLGVGLGGAVLAHSGWQIVFFVFVASEGVVLLIPISSTVSAELAPVALRGRYMGTWTLVQMGGYALGPLFGGMAMDAFGPRASFTLVAALGLLGALLFTLTAKRLRSLDEAAAGTSAADDADGEALSSIPPAM